MRLRLRRIQSTQGRGGGVRERVPLDRGGGWDGVVRVAVFEVGDDAGEPVGDVVFGRGEVGQESLDLVH